MRNGSTFGRRLLALLAVRQSAVDLSAGPHTAPCEGPSGPATILDGDTIVVAGERIRIHGIDAPELDQTFQWNGRTLVCGTMALAALEALMAGVTVRCAPVERDRYGRLVAKCYSPSGIDIGRRLVASGWALAYRRYSLDYVDAETEARAGKRGMWRGSFQQPWAWRAQNAAPAAPGAPLRSRTQRRSVPTA